MVKNEYGRALEKALSDMEERVGRRDALNAEIAGLRETVKVLTGMVQVGREGLQRISRLLDVVDCGSPSLADTIRSLLTRTLPKGRTAIEVRNALEVAQFNFDDFSNPLSACHAALKRMAIDGDVEAEQTKEGKTRYTRILKFPSIAGELEETWHRGKILVRPGSEELPPSIPTVGPKKKG